MADLYLNQAEADELLAFLALDYNKILGKTGETGETSFHDLKINKNKFISVYYQLNLYIQNNCLNVYFFYRCSRALHGREKAGAKGM